MKLQALEHTSYPISIAGVRILSLWFLTEILIQRTIVMETGNCFIILLRHLRAIIFAVTIWGDNHENEMHSFGACVDFPMFMHRMHLPLGL